MSQALLQIKKRINSVKSTSKITKSMKLVSTAKLKNVTKRRDAYFTYSSKLNEIMSFLFSSLDNNENPFFKENDKNKRLVIVITSSLGLCGSYNHNLFNYIDRELKENDDVVLLGSKGITHYKKSIFNKIEHSFVYENIKNESTITQIAKYVESIFLKGEYKEVGFIYTEYINSLKCHPKYETILPIKNNFETKSENILPIIFEPNIDDILNEIIPQYIESNIYSFFLNSEESEQSMRRNAMESATKNAEELVEDLTLGYNKARQSAITQEIIEVSSASNN